MAEELKRYKNPNLLMTEKEELGKILSEIKSFETEIKNHFDLIKGGKIQGSNKFITDQTENIISIKKNKLDVIMSMVSIEKILADYDFKDRKEDDEDGNDSKYTKLLELMNSKNSVNLDDCNADYSDDKDTDITDVLEKKFKKLCKKGEIEYTNEDLATKYEKDNIQIKVRLFDDDNWKFGAYDSNGKRVKDFPLPNEEDFEIDIKTIGNGITIAYDINTGKEFEIKRVKKKKK